MSKLIRQVVDLGKEVQHLRGQLHSTQETSKAHASAAASAMSENKSVNKECSRLRRKLAHSLELLQEYQSRMDAAPQVDDSSQPPPGTSNSGDCRQGDSPGSQSPGEATQPSLVAPNPSQSPSLSTPLNASNADGRNHISPIFSNGEMMSVVTVRPEETVRIAAASNRYGEVQAHLANGGGGALDPEPMPSAGGNPASQDVSDAMSRLGALLSESSQQYGGMPVGFRVDGAASAEYAPVLGSPKPRVLKFDPTLGENGAFYFVDIEDAAGSGEEEVMANLLFQQHAFSPPRASPARAFSSLPQHGETQRIEIHTIDSSATTQASASTSLSRDPTQTVGGGAGEQPASQPLNSSHGHSFTAVATTGLPGSMTGAAVSESLAGWAAPPQPATGPSQSDHPRSWQHPCANATQAAGIRDIHGPNSHTSEISAVAAAGKSASYTSLDAVHSDPNTDGLLRGAASGDDRSDMELSGTALTSGDPHSSLSADPAGPGQEDQHESIEIGAFRIPVGIQTDGAPAVNAADFDFQGEADDSAVDPLPADGAMVSLDTMEASAGSGAVGLSDTSLLEEPLGGSVKGASESSHVHGSAEGLNSEQNADLPDAQGPPEAGLGPSEMRFEDSQPLHFAPPHESIVSQLRGFDESLLDLVSEVESMQLGSPDSSFGRALAGDPTASFAHSLHGSHPRGSAAASSRASSVPDTPPSRQGDRNTAPSWLQSRLYEENDIIAAIFEAEELSASLSTAP